MKKYNILIVVFDVIDVHTGGVQSIVKSLSELFTSRGNHVKYLLLSDTVSHKNYDNNEYFVVSSAKLGDYQFLLELENYLLKNQFDIVLNNFGLNYHIFFEKLVEIRNNKNLNFKIINYHHNGVKDVFDNYQNITLHKFATSNTFSGKIEKALFQKIRLFRNLYLKLGKQKLWSNFNNAIKYSDANLFHFEQFASEVSTMFKNESNYFILPPIKFHINKNENIIKENIVLYVGRIELMQKRVDKLLEIWKNLENESLDWKLVIVGEGSYLNAAKDFIESNQLSNIHFVGKCEPEGHYKKAKILMLTSDFEGLGLVILEALAKQCVPIAFNCYSALNEIIIDNVNGIIIEKDNTQQYIEKLKLLMHNDHLINDLKTNYELNFENFEDEVIANNWLNLFGKLTDDVIS